MTDGAFAQAGHVGSPYEIDLDNRPVRELNAGLHRLSPESNATLWKALNPRGRHAIGVGIDAPITLEVAGHAGYYCAGMNKQATVVVHGNAGVGVAENMMSGFVHVLGDASQSAGASAHGGVLLIEGNASARCAISLKGADVIVKGSAGHMSAFMAQAGSLIVFGDAGESLGDSIYEAELYVRGKVQSLGADCIEKEMLDASRADLHSRLRKAGLDAGIDLSGFKRYGSARRLYNFHAGNAGAY